MPSPDTQRNGYDSGFVWDHLDCPRDDCDGELQQQDRFNVMCLLCERAWSHLVTEDYHQLLTEDDEVVSKVPNDDDEQRQPLEPEHYQLLSNAGRCDICGRTIDMEGDGDTLTIHDFGVDDDDLPEGHEATDQEASDAVAEALERVAESGAGYELAKVIREQHGFKVHADCLEETEYGQLPTADPEVVDDD